MVTVFSILDAFLLRPLNFPRADRLAVGLYATRERPSEPAVFVPYRDYLQMKARSPSFDTLAAAFPRAYLLGGAGDATIADGLVVTPDFFATLGVAPRLGRALSEGDADGPAAAVISYELWQRQFGGAATAVGAHVVLNGAPHEIVGATRLAGRLFDVRDSAAAPAAAALNERAAQLLFGTPAEAVGRRIGVGQGAWTEIVGVVSNTRSTAFNTLEWLTNPVTASRSPKSDRRLNR